MFNKRKVDEYIPPAREILSDCGIADGDTINKTYRGQISSFGAAVSMGSLLSAVAFFSAQGSSSTERQRLMDAIYKLITGAAPAEGNERALFDYVKDRSGTRDLRREAKNEVYNAAIALKLAMNLYELKD
jgi:CRISPR-associated protein Cmr5